MLIIRLLKDLLLSFQFFDCFFEIISLNYKFEFACFYCLSEFKLLIFFDPIEDPYLVYS